MCISFICYLQKKKMQKTETKLRNFLSKKNEKVLNLFDNLALINLQ